MNERLARLIRKKLYRLPVAVELSVADKNLENKKRTVNPRMLATRTLIPNFHVPKHASSRHEVKRRIDAMTAKQRTRVRRVLSRLP